MGWATARAVMTHVEIIRSRASDDDRPPAKSFGPFRDRLMSGRAMRALSDSFGRQLDDCVQSDLAVFDDVPCQFTVGEAVVTLLEEVIEPFGPVW